MTHIIRNAYTKDDYKVVESVNEARNFCEQRLLRSALNRGSSQFLSNLSNGIILVYEDSNGTIYRGPGF
jgi:hypothetical protein